MNPGLPVALLLCGVALLVWPQRVRRDVRRSTLSAAARQALFAVAMGVAAIAVWPTQPLAAAIVAVISMVAQRVQAARGGRGSSPIDGATAASLDLIAAGLRAGLSTEAAMRMVLFAERAAATNPGGLSVLARVHAMLAVGADPVSAWKPARSHPEFAPLASAATRSVSTGSALAQAFCDQAGSIRQQLAAAETARHSRAGVIITAPLGLCFLPAFLCLGLAPALVGLLGSFQLW